MNYFQNVGTRVTNLAGLPRVVEQETQATDAGAAGSDAQRAARKGPSDWPGREAVQSGRRGGLRRVSQSM